MQEKKSAKNLRIRKVCIVGVIPSFAFQRAKYCALELHRKLPQRFPLPEIVGLLELDWSEKLQEWRQMLGREFWCLRRPVAVFFDNRFVGSDIELIKLTTISNILIDNIPRKDMSCLKQIFRKDYMTYLKKSKRIYCYLDICVDDVYAGTLTFRLYSDILPRTCENFKTLCLGSRGPLLSYKGSRIHRIVKKGWLQGGDIQYKTGGGGFSIFCDPLEDECYGVSHDRRGVLSMANAGRHRSGSQFFITLQPSTWMDTHFVAFGQLIEGVQVLNKLENLETSYESPISKVEIKNCGKLDLGDVDDIDVMYKEEPLRPKKKKNIETISRQIIRMIMEALTAALEKKVRPPDILSDGDVISKMNLQLYFQGFYSLPAHILDRTAAYLRNLQRDLFRLMKPSATEIVESLLYDLQMAVLTRMTNLDDMRETIGREMYNKMVSRIGMTMKECKKSYVRRLINQIVRTAENMVELVTKKVLLMKKQSQNLKTFQDRMQNWVRSFVLQETFEGDNYFIAERPYNPPKEKEEKPKEGKFCCEEERKKREAEIRAKLKEKYPSDDLCCLGSQARLNDSELDLYDYFSTCRYDLKGKKPRKERMPLLDLIEISRFKLRWIRRQERRQKTSEILCTEKKIRKWMEEVVYTSETDWLKDSIFPKDCRVLDHVEEVMYGAMTAGLLEMYYFMDQYLRLCGGKRRKLVTRTIFPEDSKTELGFQAGTTGTTGTEAGRLESQDQKHQGKARFGEEDRDSEDLEQDGEGNQIIESPGSKLEPCPCGHPCCDCPFKPKHKKGETGTEEKEGEGGGEGGGGGEGEGGKSGADASGKTKTDKEKEGTEEGGGEKQLEPGLTDSQEKLEKPCESDETLVDFNLVMAQKLVPNAENIDMNSFGWLKPYVLEQGCDLKSDFATRVHNWIEGEQFNSKGIISKHSLVTRASLLSLSFSLTELLKEENDIKTDIKDFIYDLWDLYFEEMFKEAYLEFPPKEDEDEDDDEEKERQGRRKGRKGKGRGKGKDGDEGEDESEESGDEGTDGKKGKRKKIVLSEECTELKDLYPGFDLEKYCKEIQEKKGKFGLEELERECGKELEEQEGGSAPTPTSQKAMTPRSVASSSEKSKTDQDRTPSKPSTPDRSRTSRPSVTETSKVFEKEPEESQPPQTSTPERAETPQTETTEKAEIPPTEIPEKAEIPPTEIPEKAEIPSTEDPEKAEVPPTEDREKPEIPSTAQEDETPQTRPQKDRTPRMSEPREETETPQLQSQEELPAKNAALETGSQTKSPKAQPQKEGGSAPETPVKKKKSPIVVRELVDLPSEEEVRNMPPYVPPFWLTFLTELTKQALGAFARVSQLPRRLYLKTDSELAFDDRMKEWFEFNAFNPQQLKGREIMDYIALHHKSLTDLEDTARSFLKKKKCSELINRCTRFASADDVAGDIMSEALSMSHDTVKSDLADQTVELFVSGLLSSAISSKARSASSFEEEGESDVYSMETDEPQRTE